MQKIVLDENGNEIVKRAVSGGKLVLDENGNEVLKAELGGREVPTPDMTATPEMRQRALGAVAGFNTGVAKGIGSTVYGLGKLVHKIPGVSDLVGKYPEKEELRGVGVDLDPRGTAESVGHGTEQIAEFFVPGTQSLKLGKLAKGAMAGMKGGKLLGLGADAGIQAATAAGVTAVQGGDVETAGVLGAATPLIGGGIKRGAPLIRAGLAQFTPRVRLKPIVALVKAIKPGKHNFKFEKDLASAIPDLKATEKLTGKAIESVDDLVETSKATKKRLWDEYEAMFGGKPPVLDATPVSDAIFKTITSRTAHLDATTAKAILEKATKYDKLKLDARELENWLQDANAELHAFYAKNPHMRSVASRSDPHLAGLVAEAEALRDVLYNAMPGVKGLKARYGALINVENEAMGRSIVAKRQWEESLAEQIAAAQGALGLPSKVMHPLQTVEKMANVAVAKLVKERNTSDYLVKHAFADWGKKP